ncbi:MAG: hypothetical protein KJ737_14045 [Proteobacteria bacterium]|nr:hypothetical protein [Pseudomonadota bacterium]
MKQKFLLLKSEDHTELIIRELAELDTGKYSLICEEKHASDAIKKAMETPNQILDMLRSNNMFPPNHMIHQIIRSIMELFAEEGKDSVELFFDDIEHITNEGENIFNIDEEDNETAAIDNLLEEEIDEDFIDEIDVKTDDPIDNSIEQISIDDTLGDEDE